MHRHTWTVESREVLPSPYEQLNADGRLTDVSGKESMFVKPVIVTYKCATCPAQKVVRV